MKLRLGTRGSELALTQSRSVAERLRREHPGLEIEEVVVKTDGDRDQVTPLDAQGGVGLFTKALERALIAEEVDVVVHSLKDLPTVQPDGLTVAAVPERASPWDAWISEKFADLIDLPDGARIATGSLRRRAQILNRHPGIEVVGIRGNIDTRLAKYGDSADGLLLAVAGLERSGRDDVIRGRLGPTEMTPAPGQGALGLETRTGDAAEPIVAALDDPPARAAVTAERSFMRTIEAGCHMPIGAIANVDDGVMSLLGMVALPDGARLLRLSVEGPTDDAAGLGERLAEVIRRGGGAEILDTLRVATSHEEGAP